METKYVMCNRETKELKTLTQLEMDRFFDNRNPDDWILGITISPKEEIDER